MEEVKVWEEEVVIPTYEAGVADKNPMFLDKRVYQGSSGKVYPYPVIEKIADEKADKVYQALYLENEYIKVMILPELGGRIQRAYDKTNGYDFVYYNHVIKPALVGLTGPWISGGIEFNWPQHHRPTTFLPVDYQIKEQEDGSKSVWINDVDQMYGTKGIAIFTLYPGKAYIEIKGQLYNRTPLPQTFLWWANPAVAVNDDTKSIFPPDVHAVMDHGKRDVSRFPIATGVYYKHDYSEGVDISRYKNIPVPTSYMAEKSEFDFVGGYDYRKKAGILHVADHHVSPGKKQWTWGCGDFGKAWDRNLTDEDGPYIELMTGVFTDNQPDFTWLKPFEEKTFTQYFMPYKEVGEVKNASIHAAVNLECKEEGIYLCVYATGVYEEANVVLCHQGKTVYDAVVKLSPNDILETTVPLKYEDETEISLSVYANGECLVTYSPVKTKVEKLPEPAKPAKAPKEIMTNEELYLNGLHIEQYRHATYRAEDYYLEGLKRDEGDIRINNAYGMLLFRSGCYEEAEGHFRKAIERLTDRNPNPYDSEAYYNLGLACFYQKRKEEAYDAFYKAAWSNEQQEMSFYYLAAIACEKQNYVSALDFINRSLIKNSHNVKARGLKAVILRKLGRIPEALAMIDENKKIDAFDYLSMFEEYFIQKDQGQLEQLKSLMRDFHESYLQVARDYAESGLYKEAVFVLRECGQKRPMLKYYEAFYEEELGNTTSAQECISLAETYPSDYCFPNKLEDIAALEYAIRRNNNASKACYYLGTLLYDKKQIEKATKLWEQSAKMNDSFPTVFRNLALAYYNHYTKTADYSRKESLAKACMERAFTLNKEDARVFLELDQLYKKLHFTAAERLAFYDSYPEVYRKRDDLVIEYITLLNLIGDYKKAYELTGERNFHPWEGGEGKITTQYTIALVELARKAIRDKDYKTAIDLLNRALVYPKNLGEGKLEGSKDNNIYYYLGCSYEALQQKDKATEYYKLATIGNAEPAGMMYYNDQPADMILYQGLAYEKLGERASANARFYKLIDYGERHQNDEMKIEYFAVSLPDFLIFNEDLTKRNQAHCHYLVGLGNLGLKKEDEARQEFLTALQYEPSHQNAIRYLRLIEEE